MPQAIATIIFEAANADDADAIVRGWTVTEGAQVTLTIEQQQTLTISEQMYVSDGTVGAGGAVNAE